MAEKLYLQNELATDQRNGESDTSYIGRVFAGGIRYLGNGEKVSESKSEAVFTFEVLTNAPESKVNQYDFKAIEQALIGFKILEKDQSVFGVIKKAEFEKPQKRDGSNWISLVLKYEVDKIQYNDQHFGDQDFTQTNCCHCECCLGNYGFCCHCGEHWDDLD